ncbi:MAG TPA: glycosyltransferase [Chloroflexia bacterium]|nr:glycosyltransferase [Chloroflexia bacterium]
MTGQRRVRVLQLIDVLGPGGAEMLLHTLASSLDASRFDLHVCGLRPDQPYDLAPQIRALGVPVSAFNQRNAYDVPTLIALVRYMRRHRIDIIHTHLLASDIMGRVAGFFTRTPVVSTVHNSREDFDHEPARRRWMERSTAKLWCRRLIVVSPALREEIAAWYGLPVSRFVAIPNGVDTTRFRPMPALDKAALKRDLLGDPAVREDTPLVLNVARLVPQKGLAYLARAARLVLDARPDARFAVVGQGPLKDDLLKQVEELGLDGKFVLAGVRSDVPELMAAGDVFVLSSLWEGLPISLLEAMSSGCPVVATEVGGVGGVVQSDRTGLLVPAEDPDALAQAILRCLNNPQEAQQRAGAAREWAHRHYSMETWVRKLEQLYLHELGRRSR